jgi:hypothetical protein
MGRGADFPHVARVADSLLRYAGAAKAIDFMALYVRRLDRPLPLDVVAQALEVLTVASAEELRGISSYEVDQLVAYLVESSFDESRLAMLEWRLLPARGYREPSLTLERALSRDPAFFAQIVGLAFKPVGGEADPNVPAHVATTAYKLLSDWRIVPGSQPDGSVDEAKLNSWLTTARELLKQARRTEVGDVVIGRILAKGPAAADGMWPALPIRRAVQRLGSPELEQGFVTEIFNSRGVTSRGVFDGGAQERELAASWQTRAARIRDEWPRLGAMFDGVAARYEADARERDQEAERLRTEAATER